MNGSCKTKRGCDTDSHNLPNDGESIDIYFGLYGRENDTSQILHLFDGIMDEVMEKERQMEAMAA